MIIILKEEVPRNNKSFLDMFLVQRITEESGTIVSGNPVDEKNAVQVKRKRASRLVAYSFACN